MDQGVPGSLPLFIELLPDRFKYKKITNIILKRFYSKRKNISDNQRKPARHLAGGSAGK